MLRPDFRGQVDAVPDERKSFVQQEALGVASTNLEHYRHFAEMGAFGHLNCQVEPVSFHIHFSSIVPTPGDE